MTQNVRPCFDQLVRYDDTSSILHYLMGNYKKYNLISELNKNQLLCNLLCWHSDRKVEAQTMLITALKLANHTGFISHFIIEGKAMAQQLRQLLQLNVLEEMEQHRAQRILHDINRQRRHQFAHFDEKSR